MRIAIPTSFIMSMTPTPRGALRVEQLCRTAATHGFSLPRTTPSVIHFRMTHQKQSRLPAEKLLVQFYILSVPRISPLTCCRPSPQAPKSLAWPTPEATPLTQLSPPPNLELTRSNNWRDCWSSLLTFTLLACRPRK